MFTRQHSKLRPIFVVTDILFVYIAFQLAYITRAHLPLERLFFLTPTARAFLLTASMAVWVFAGLWLRVYDHILRTPIHTLSSYTVRQSALAAIAIVLLEYAQRLDLSRPFLALLVTYAFLLGFLARLLARWLSHRWLGGASARRFLYIAGTGENALRLARLVELNERYGLTLAGFLAPAPGQILLARSYPVHAFDALANLLETRVVDEILFAVDWRQLPELEDVFLLCEEEGVRTRLHAAFFPHVRTHVDIEHLEAEPLLTFSGAPHDDVRLMVKRGADVLLAACALLLLAPLLLAIALLIRLTSPGPVIFRQQRCGLNGRRFTLFKFRTMVADAETRKNEFAHLNVKKTAFKIPNDPRLTPAGRWLRKFSLDELPQLWNILKGEMSLVGPRPPVPEEVARYERWQRRRLRMRPGLTCLWTLAGRDELSFEEWMRLDLEYIDKWSLSLDLSILLRTIPHVLLGKGAY